MGDSMNFCRGPEEKIGKWADHLPMDEEHIIVAQWTGVVEVLNSTTQGPRGIIPPGALDVVDPGARRIEEKIIINSGVEMPRRLPNGIYPQSMVIVVRISILIAIDGKRIKCMAKFSELK